MMKKIAALSAAFFFIFSTAGFSAPPKFQGPPPGSVLETAKDAGTDSPYQQALQNGAQIEPTKDGISFTVWKAPQNFDPKTGITLVSLHGHAGWATRDFVVWQEALKHRNYAYLGIQWWYGRSMESVGYAKPAQIYGWIENALKQHSVAPGRVIFQGYSMGSANSYGVTLYDHQVTKNDYFAVSIANSGAMESDFPLYRRIFSGEFGKTPFQGTRWLLYCSQHDKERPQACRQMSDTQKWLTGFGAKVDWFYQDTKGGHGGFMIGKVYNEALDIAEKILSEK